MIGDLGRVWILADVFEYDAKRLRAGSAARVVYQAEGVPAVVSEVLPIFDDDARTMKFRLELPNPGYRFKPGMFVDVEFPLRLESTLTVPASAVVDSGTRKTIFVDHGGGYFEPRAVETGWRLGDHVEIVKGLMAGDRVAVSGTFLIDSESRMQAASQRAGPAPKAAQTRHGRCLRHGRGPREGGAGGAHGRPRRHDVLLLLGPVQEGLREGSPALRQIAVAGTSPPGASIAGFTSACHFQIS